MNLIIDIGNTAVKYVLFEQDEILSQQVNHCDDMLALSQFAATEGLGKAIVMSTGKVPTAFANAINALPCKPIWFNSETAVPIQNLYQTPHTLGPDRLAAAVGANSLFPHQDTLIIDLGTCITYDLVDHQGCYLGGNIAPGMSMRFEAMHEHTAHLPLIRPENEWPSIIGGNTTEALTGGVMWGILAEIDFYIHKIRAERPSLKVVLTGGDAQIFHEHIDLDGIVMDKNIAHRGLNIILNQNDI